MAAISSIQAGSISLSWRRQEGFSGYPCAHCAPATPAAPSKKLPALTIRADTNTELAQVLTFSAFPFLAVTAIANSGLGKWLSDRLEREKGRLEAERLQIDIARERAQIESSWYGDDRPKFLGFVPYPYPAYLDGSKAGDFGFDPLGLARDPAALERYFNLEVIHGRWAMLGALGALVPELLVRYTNYSFLDPVWWSVGYTKLQGDDLDYLGIPGLHIAGNQGIAIIAVAQALLMLGPEYARYTGIKALEPLGIYLPGDINYPGGWLFDPLGVSKNPKLFEDMKIREMKNGRLAMVAWLGFAAQAVVTRQSLLENWDEFLADPEKNNWIAANFGDFRDFSEYVAAKSAILEGIQNIQGREEYKIVASASSAFQQVLSSQEWQEIQVEVGKIVKTIAQVSLAQ